MFYSVLKNNNRKTAHKLRLILADFVRLEWDFPLPWLDMSIGEFIGGSGLSTERYMQNIVQSSY